MSVVARRLVPEMLDAMDPADPAARASRRDLRRINALMMNRRVLAGLLRAHLAAPPRRLVDLGCGDGHGALALARGLAPDWPGVTLTLVDARPSVSAELRGEIAALGWRAEIVASDVFGWLAEAPRADAVVASLFLHHFEGAALGRLMAGIAGRAGLLAAAEPRRSSLSLWAARATWAIGANAVTRHDAPASVRAGFRPGELSAHWPGRVLCDGPRGPFTHAFAALGGAR